MPKFELDSDARSRIGSILTMVTISGSEATTVLEIASRLNDKDGYPLLELSDEHVSFILDKMNKVQIPGSAAMMLVTTRLVLQKPVEGKHSKTKSSKSGKTGSGKTNRR